jgi:HK97 family phage prohead protease
MDRIDDEKAMRRMMPPAVTKAVGERQVRVIASTLAEDRMGDIVRVEGIDLSRYNNVVLFNHDPNMAVARAEEIGVAEGELRALVQFPPEGTSENSDEVYRLIKAGVINSTSIGFMPRKATRREPDGYDFTESELLEFSFVAVPANPEARIVERSLLGAEAQIALARRNLASIIKAEPDDLPEPQPEDSGMKAEPEEIEAAGECPQGGEEGNKPDDEMRAAHSKSIARLKFLKIKGT